VIPRFSLLNDAQLRSKTFDLRMVAFRTALLAAASLASTLAAPGGLVERQNQNLGLNYNQNWGDGMRTPPVAAASLFI
jgi:hypothetical protein